jgi:hypothetical protein
LAAEKPNSPGETGNKPLDESSPMEEVDDNDESDQQKSEEIVEAENDDDDDEQDSSSEEDSDFIPAKDSDENSGRKTMTFHVIFQGYG